MFKESGAGELVQFFILERNKKNITVNIHKTYPGEPTQTYGYTDIFMIFQILMMLSAA